MICLSYKNSSKYNSNNGNLNDKYNLKPTIPISQNRTDPSRNKPQDRDKFLELEIHVKGEGTDDSTRLTVITVYRSIIH